MREKKEKWFELCEQAAKEQDPEKLMILIKEINALLQEKDERLKNPKSVLPPSSQPDNCQTAVLSG